MGFPVPNTKGKQMKKINEVKTIESSWIDLINCSELSKIELRLYMWLYMNSQDALSRGELYTPSQEVLAELLGCHQPQISKALNSLSEKGLLDYNHYRCNGVKICIPVKPDSAAKILTKH